MFKHSNTMFLGWDVGIKNLSFCLIDFNEKDSTNTRNLFARSLYVLIISVFVQHVNWFNKG